jgi:hypothetical protein
MTNDMQTTTKSGTPATKQEVLEWLLEDFIVDLALGYHSLPELVQLSPDETISSFIRDIDLTALGVGPRAFTLRAHEIYADFLAHMVGSAKTHELA